jgi:VanZ family protein
MRHNGLAIMPLRCYAFRSLWVLWLCFVITGSFAPEHVVVEAALYVPLFSANDKVLHILAYLGAAILAVLSFQHRRTATAAALSMLLVGLGVELGQMLTPTRTADARDLLANAIGVFCGCALGLLVRPVLLGRPDGRLTREESLAKAN